jgi:hypothetical protein
VCELNFETFKKHLKIFSSEEQQQQQQQQQQHQDSEQVQQCMRQQQVQASLNCIMKHLI